MWDELTIVTSVTGGYGRYLMRWVNSIAEQTVKPLCVVIFSHGPDDRELSQSASQRLAQLGVMTYWHHEEEQMEFGLARNRAVSFAKTTWVMHLDCDDTLYSYAIADFQHLSPRADVISAGYTLDGAHLSHSVRTRQRLYKSATGRQALDLSSLASGISPFRRAFWETSPYRADMLGAWDTALWIGFAHLGARFVPTTRPVFKYLQHDDSIFNTRRRTNGWTRALTSAQLKSLRRGDNGTTVIIPWMQQSSERDRVLARVRAHYATHHPMLDVVIGTCPSVQWVKGAAVNAALSHTMADILVIADGDCIVDPLDLELSIQLVKHGAPWSMPHHMVYRATQTYTDRICGQSADILPDLPFEDACERRHEGALGGGIVVMRRVMYEAFGGIPLSFVGWGSEDRALGVIANTLLGSCERGRGDLLHLWHPAQSHEHGSGNLQTLRSIGSAALRGKDALMAMLSSLAHTTVPGIQRDVQQRMRRENPINRVASSQQNAPNALNRRRVP